jgi:hypothetical protein
MPSFSYAPQPIITADKARPRAAASAYREFLGMSLLTDRFERTSHSSHRQAPALSMAHWALVKRVCARALAVLLMVGLLGGIIAVKTIIFLPHISY